MRIDVSLHAKCPKCGQTTSAAKGETLPPKDANRKCDGVGKKAV